jgi:hypothetical protein
MVNLCRRETGLFARYFEWLREGAVKKSGPKSGRKDPRAAVGFVVDGKGGFSHGLTVSIVRRGRVILCKLLPGRVGEAFGPLLSIWGSHYGVTGLFRRPQVYPVLPNRLKKLSFQVVFFGSSSASAG